MRMRSIWILGIIVLVFVRFICCHNEKFESAETPLQVDLTLIQSAAATGAVCLDGTLPGYHLHRGFGSGANSWLIQLEGGGWCNDINTCVYRKKTRRGSSNYMEKVLQFTGILSNKPEENPDFYNWNRVKLRYCDGASFSGEGSNEAASLQFRGQRIWVAAMEYLMSNGMKDATQALLSGCSAGGLASIFHCDEFHDLFQGNTKVKCLADAGMFLDAVNVAGGRTLRTLYNGVVTLQGVSKNLPQYCTSKMDATLCFFPENLVANIKTPLFLLNAAYDVWQVLYFKFSNFQSSLGPVWERLFLRLLSRARSEERAELFGSSVFGDFYLSHGTKKRNSSVFALSLPPPVGAKLCFCAFSLRSVPPKQALKVHESLAPGIADPNGYWKSCKTNNANCNASQIQFLQDFRNDMINSIKGFTLPQQNGWFINSCFAHCQTERQDTWFGTDSPAIANKGIAQSVGDWYFDRIAVKEIDCPYPCDKTCHNLVFN